jgi:outer membrane protein assembly factor BamB
VLRRFVPILLLLAVVLMVMAAPVTASDWPRFGGDPQLTNAVPSAAAPDFTASAASSLESRWAAHLDGAVIASPLYADNVTVGDRGHDVVYAATQAGSVYAIDATDGSVLWQQHLGTATTTCPEAEAGVTSAYGVASTGVLDRGRNLLYVIGATGLLYALDLGTGQIAPGWPLQLIADTSGEFVWGGLTLADDRLYVPVASYCDEPGLDGNFATGRLIAVDVDTVSVVSTFQVVPQAASLGGIWGFGGSSVDPLTGHIWTATGNSWVTNADCGCLDETAGYAEAVVELDPDLNVVAWDRPYDEPGGVQDADFGSTPLLFQPTGCPPMAAAYAKNGELYVWQRDALADGPIWSFYAGPSGLDDSFVGEPSYTEATNTLIVSDARTYDPQAGITHLDAVTAFTLGPGCSFPNAPTWTAPDIGRGPKAPALIVGDLAFVVGGYVPGLFILDAGTGAVLWSTSFDGPVLAPPAFGDNQVYIGDTTGTLAAIGIGPPPPPPVKLTAGKVLHTPVRAGRPFAASMIVRSEGKLVRGYVTCAGKLATRTLPASRGASTANGRATCTWKIPSGTRGRRFAGSISETYRFSRVTRSFSATVK